MHGGGADGRDPDLVNGDALEIGRGAAPASDVRLTGKTEDIARIFLEGLPDGDAPSGVTVDGDAALLAKLVGSFTRGDV